MSDPDLLAPSVDPNKSALGIRRVSARNEASTRSVMMVRDHVVITDEKESIGNDPVFAAWLRRGHHQSMR